MSVLTNAIENAPNIPEVPSYLPSSYDNDIDTLKREGANSDSAELNVSTMAQRTSWDSESSGSGSL